MSQTVNNHTPVNYAQAASKARSGSSTPSISAPSTALASITTNPTYDGRDGHLVHAPPGSEIEAVTLSHKPSAGLPPPAAINFGSLNDTPAPLSSSPASPSAFGSHLQPGSKPAFGSIAPHPPLGQRANSRAAVSQQSGVAPITRQIPGGMDSTSIPAVSSAFPISAPSATVDFNAFFQGDASTSARASSPSFATSAATSNSTSATPNAPTQVTNLSSDIARRSSIYEASVSSSTSSPRPPSAVLPSSTFSQQFASSSHGSTIASPNRPFSPASPYPPNNALFAPQGSYGQQKTSSVQHQVNQPFPNGSNRSLYGSPSNHNGRPPSGPHRYNSSQNPTSPRLTSSPLPPQATSFSYGAYPQQWYSTNGQFPSVYASYGAYSAYPAGPSSYLAGPQHTPLVAPASQASHLSQSSPGVSGVNGLTLPASQRSSTASPAMSSLSLTSTTAINPSAVTSTDTTGPAKTGVNPIATEFSMPRDFQLAKPGNKAIQIRKPPTSTAKTAPLQATSVSTAKSDRPLKQIHDRTADLPLSDIPSKTTVADVAHSVSQGSRLAPEDVKNVPPHVDQNMTETSTFAGQSSADADENNRSLSGSPSTEIPSLIPSTSKLDLPAGTSTEEAMGSATQRELMLHPLADVIEVEQVPPAQQTPLTTVNDDTVHRTSTIPAVTTAICSSPQRVGLERVQPEEQVQPNEKTDLSGTGGTGGTASLLIQDASPLPNPTPSPESQLQTDNAPEDEMTTMTMSANARSTSYDNSDGPSALALAVPISKLDHVAYPPGISAPRQDLNIGCQDGAFRYDRDFLLQFMEVCQHKPDQMPPPEDLGMLDSEPSTSGMPSRVTSTSRGGRGSMPPPPVRQLSVGGPNRGIQAMGAFGMSPAKSSEARFQQATAQMVMGGFASNFGGKTGVLRTPSQQMGSRSGSKRGDNRKSSHAGGPRGNSAASTVQLGIDGQPVAPLEKTENSWSDNINKSRITSKQDENSPEIVQRKVKALLNKLTVDNFPSISKQILAWADRSKEEIDGRILRQVIQLIFEKATDEAAWSTMYARLCRMLQDTVSADVRDHSLKDQQGNAVGGGTLFRKYLLNRCQEDYERGWANKESMTAAAASKAAEDEAKRVANEKAESEATSADGVLSKEAEILSDEYYAAQKAKRQGLGLVKFIGELFKLQMLTARIMHECVRKLLGNLENPEEEDIESLCRLLSTVGHLLDDRSIGGEAAQKSAAAMKIYFDRLEILRKNTKLSSRIRFMIQDLAEVRQNGWQERTDTSGPKTIHEIHADAARAQAEEARRTASGGRLPRGVEQMLPRGGSRSGRERTGPDGWSTIQNVAPSARPSKAGDLQGFGKVRQPQSGTAPTFGPSGVFGSKGRVSSKDISSPSDASRQNAFAALETADTPDPSELVSSRPRLQLAPRTLPLADTGDRNEADADRDEGVQEVEDSASVVDAADEAAVSRSIDNSVKEFFELKDFEEAVLACQQLSSKSRPRFISGLCLQVIEMRDDAVQQLCCLFERFVDEQAISSEEIATGFEALIKDLDDLGADVPKAFQHAARLLRAAQLNEHQVVTLSEAMESIEGDDEETRRVVRDRLLETWRQTT